MSKEIFEELLGKIVPQEGVDQIIALRTASGRIFVMENRDILSGDTGDEALFLHSMQMQGQTQVTHLVCRWFDGSIDLPSIHFREKLLEINGNNMDTWILLQGESGYVAKQLQITLPPKKETD
jgi:hypothetical protein